MNHQVPHYGTTLRDDTTGRRLPSSERRSDGLTVPDPAIPPQSSRAERRKRPRPDAGRCLLVHGGYTRSRQVGECNGHQWSPTVTRNGRSAGQRSRYQAALDEAGRSSSLPTRLPRALRALAHDAWSPWMSLTLRSSWEPTPPLGGASSFAPIVPPACHKQRAPAVSSGQSRSLREDGWAGRRPLTLGGKEPGLMACKGSPVPVIMPAIWGRAPDWDGSS